MCDGVRGGRGGAGGRQGPCRGWRGASPQAFGDLPRCWAPHQEGIGARALECAKASPQAVGPALTGGGGAPGVRSGFPPGAGSVVCGHRPAEVVLMRGSCPFMAQGAWGTVPTLAPGGSCWVSLQGGRTRLLVFSEVSSLPWQNPSGLFAPGNLR